VCLFFSSYLYDSKVIDDFFGEFFRRRKVGRIKKKKENLAVE
jgi:hypothetical protein